jgi:hypothetical protein
MRSIRLGVKLAVLMAMSVVVMEQWAAAEVTVEPSEKGAVVKVDGKPFAEYLKKAGHQPAVWPVIGPTGKAMTRSYPDGPLLDGEMNDHPHHHSIWFTHGDVNQRDFWTEHKPTALSSEIKHRDFVKIESGPTARIVTTNDWISDGKKMLEDGRTLVFGEDKFGRYIDFAVTLNASEGDVTFGETKEGSFGVRANGPLTVDAKKGAKLTNNHGMMDGDAWGMFADWIDDYGPVEGEVVGVALFSHPDNYRHPTRWHARTYGLLAANPFGEGEFPKDASQPKQGPKKLAKGEKMTLRYRVLLHAGDPQQADVAGAFKEFAADSGQAAK